MAMDETPSVALHHGLLRLEAGIDVALVLAALDVDIGTDEAEELDSGRLRVDGHPIDAVEGGHVLRPKLLGDEGPVGSLVHHRVAGDGHEQAIAQPGRLLKVTDMAGVDDVEAAVAEDDGFLITLSVPDERLRAGQGHDLLRPTHA